MAQLSAMLASLMQSIRRMIRRRGPGPRENRASPQPVIALVCFLKQPRRMDAAVVIRAIEKAYGRRFNLPGTGYVAKPVPPPPHSAAQVVAAKTPSHLIAVSYCGRRYFDTPPAPTSAGRTALYRAVADHKGFITVDRMGDAPPPEQIYPVLAKVLAELIGPDCSVIFCTETRATKLVDADTAAILKSDIPLDALRRGGSSPVINRVPNDSELAAAQAEARLRWPEFVSAFTGRNGNDLFFAKIPLATGAGGFEHIWLKLERLEDDWVTGTLGNVPRNIPGHRYGDRLRIPIRKVEDWAYEHNGQVIGGFTTKVFTARQQPQKAR